MKLVLTIDVAEDPPCGDIVPEDGSPIGFVGWLGLLGCLSTLVDSARGEIPEGGLAGKLDPGGEAEL
jgi:hypothetical protein